MTAFDPNAYRKEVLKPLLDGGQHQIDDPFAVLGLDPSVDDDELIRERVGEVVAFWRKEQSSPRYKGLASALLKQADALSAQVLDAGRRTEARHRVQDAAATADAAAAAKIDDLLDTLERRHGGIPRDRLDRLRSLAASLGVTAGQIDQRLAGRTIVDEQSQAVEPIAAGTRRQVTQLLAELARLDPESGSHRTLYGYLGLPVGAAAPAIESRREALDARNRQRRHDRLRTVVDELLALCGTLLVDGDPRRYLAGIEESVREDLRPAVETAVLLDDKVSAAETERLTREAIAAGLDGAAARELVIEVARSLSAPIDVGTAPDYVVCAACSAACTPDPDDNDATCDRCLAPLFRPCPQCGRQAARSDVRCRACRFDLRAFDEAADDLERAEADLNAGRLQAASERVAAAAAWGEDLPDLVRLRDRVAAVERTVGEHWDRLLAALDEGRSADARADLAALDRLAIDRDGPDGATTAEVTARLDALDAKVEAAVREAKHSSEGTEVALVALLARFPGAPAVAAALAELGVEPPAAVTAESGSETVKIRWEASASRGPIEYVVERQVERTGGASAVVGRTAGTAIEDAGAPAGEPLTYAVTAVRLGDEAVPARSDVVVSTPTVGGLVAVNHDGAIELRWAARPSGDVTVERFEANGDARTLRAGPAGMLDTAVVSGVEYRYRVTVTYPGVAGNPAVTSEAAEVAATAFSLPGAPQAPTIVPQGRSLTLTAVTDPGCEAQVLRLAAPPSVSPGTVLDGAGRRRLGPSLAGRDGTFFDAADSGPRWYLSIATVGEQAVVGEAVLHPGVAEVADVTIGSDGDGLVVRWTWPPACTEVVIIWSRDQRTVEPGAPGTAEARTTNTAYDIKDGWRPGIAAGPLSVLVLAAARVDGERVTVPSWSPASRATSP